MKYADNYFEALNKADLLDSAERAHWSEKTRRHPQQILVSAVTGEGCDTLLQAIARQLNKAHESYSVTLPATEGRIAAWLYENGAVQKLENAEDMNIYTVNLSAEKFARLQHLVQKNDGINIRKI